MATSKRFIPVCFYIDGGADFGPVFDDEPSAEAWCAANKFAADLGDEEWSVLQTFAEPAGVTYVTKVTTDMYASFIRNAAGDIEIGPYGLAMHKTEPVPATEQHRTEIGSNTTGALRLPGDTREHLVVFFQAVGFESPAANEAMIRDGAAHQRDLLADGDTYDRVLAASRR